MKIADFVRNRWMIEESEPHWGLEIEVEGYRGHDPGTARNRWVTTDDGSLRHGGVEFLSDGPLTRANLRRDVRVFYEWLSRHDWETGIRTSTHVHMNVLGHSVLEVCAAGILYTLVEPLLFRYCGPLREENIYCVPWYRSRDELEHLKEIVATQEVGIFGCTCKYSALYLEPVIRFGTMEFRQAPVFARAQDLLNWCEMIERIVYSGFETPDQVIEAFRELTIDEFVEGVFGPRLTQVLRSACERSFSELLEEYDVETSAEIPLACTYKPNSWFTVDYGIEGHGARNYHQAIARPRPERVPEWIVDDEAYDEDGEVYIEEEEY